ncbi:unnamed protein product [Adineta steineri]|uniref:Uncharacterized protein n=1 Tax=Adineta steineri TaxID=433720 RepID=A0A813Q0P9_9BILA|nr:unnamed protein product [Adineta steineri]CAF0796728.1 unnamed protein product [Adineta steineri]CAF0949665.1 unnamed protein product [Adineta steineri]CAF3594216.1 unnamed protein product [Adineta steineri]CAF3666502.1 unnamed protein product [Adineta steineri]
MAMTNFQTVKKPTISSSFYDSYTEKPVKWYEIVDAYRTYTETYLPLRLETWPREMWEAFKNFFKVTEPEEVEDDPVTEVQRTRADGNIIKTTEYDLTNDKYDARISNAVRTHTEKNKIIDRTTSRALKAEASAPQNPNPYPDRAVSTSRRHRHSNQIAPSPDDCPECAALAARNYPTMCDCNECRAKRATYPGRVPYCDCRICRNTRRS